LTVIALAQNALPLGPLDFGLTFRGEPAVFKRYYVTLTARSTCGGSIETATKRSSIKGVLQAITGVTRLLVLG
jgi:hypothetical protein